MVRIKTHRIILFTLAVAVILLCVFYLKNKDSGRLEISFLDIGQGDAIYIRTPSGRDMLVDGGPSRSVLRRLSEEMPWYDRRVDVVLETHPDADHIGGLPDVLSRYSVGVFLEPGVESTNAIDDELERVREERGVDKVVARAGMRIDFGDGAVFDVLFPDTDVSKFETNMASIVGMIRFGSTSAMLTGDSPKQIESKLVSTYGAGLESDILKAGHHGSRISSSEAFVRAVAPAYAVISAGKDNRYGHPHKEVIDLLSSLGMSVARTDDSGTLRFMSDGNSFVMK